MGRGYLLMRRGGALWGLENAAVESLTRGTGEFRVEVRGGVLCIDEVVGVVAELAVQPLAAVLRRFWPGEAGSLAVHAEQPLVVVDPERPPRVLLGPGWERTGNDRTGDGEGVGQDA
jgi:hypothetical protein